MNSKERMLTALNMGKPDMLPVTIHQWQPYHLNTFMGGKSEIEAFKSLGMDASATYWPAYKKVNTTDWVETGSTYQKDDITVTDYDVKTPKGHLSYQMQSNKFTSWYSQHLIKKPEDIYLFKEFYPRLVIKKEELITHYDELGDGGIARCGVPNFQGGCYQAAQVLYGTEELIYACYDDEDWVKEFLDIILERKIQYVYEQLKYAKVDLVETGGGGSSDTVISPEMHKKFCLPYDQKLHNAIKDVGHKTVYHTCGGMINILDLIAQNNCDASETLSPSGIGGNVDEGKRMKVKTELGSKVALIGGMDQINLLTNGTPEKIQKEVHKLFETFGKDGGYIMSACDHFFEAPVENLKAYVKSARECKY